MNWEAWNGKTEWEDGARPGDGTVWGRGRLLLCLGNERCP